MMKKFISLLLLMTAPAYAGSSSGGGDIQAARIKASPTASWMTVPNATDTFVGKATTDTLSNKTVAGGIFTGTSTFPNSSSINGSGNAVFGGTFTNGTNAMTTGAITSSGLFTSTAAGTSTFGTTSNSATVKVIGGSGSGGVSVSPPTVATSNTTHAQSPYLSTLASIWNGSAAVSKNVAYTNYGVSGQNSQYYGAIESSDIGNIITYRGDSSHVAVGTTPQTETFYVNGTLRTTGAATFGGSVTGNLIGNVTGNLDLATGNVIGTTTSGVARFNTSTGNLEGSTTTATELAFVHNVTSALCGINQSCTETNKTFTSPTINSATIGSSTLSGNMNFAENQATAFRVENQASDPVAGNAGRVYYNTANGVLEYDNGSVWSTLGTATAPSWSSVLATGNTAGTNILPDSNNARDIGSSGSKWKDLYMAGNSTLGTVTSGTWSATAIGASKGGTGIDSSASSGIPHVASGTWTVSPIVNADVSGSAAIAYSKLALTGAVLNADLAGSIAYSKLSLTGAILNADLAGSIAYSKLSLTGAILNADLAGSIADTKLSTIATAGKVSDSALPSSMATKTFTGTTSFPGTSSVDGSGNAVFGGSMTSAGVKTTGAFTATRTNDTSTGTVTDVVSTGRSNIIFTASTTLTIQGIRSGASAGAGTADGQQINLFNATGNSMTLKDTNAGAAANDKIKTPGAVDFVVVNQGGVSLVYDGSAGFWRVISK